jgi:hypothetical protein
MPKKAKITQERVEYNVFLFDEPLKGSKSLKIFKISLTFRFDKLSNLSKSVHTGENSQILTVSNKKIFYSESYCNMHIPNLIQGGKLTIPFYLYFPVLVSNRPLSALLWRFSSGVHELSKNGRKEIASNELFICYKCNDSE